MKFVEILSIFEFFFWWAISREFYQILFITSAIFYCFANLSYFVLIIKLLFFLFYSQIQRC